VVEQVRQLPDQSLLCGAWKASRCNLRGPKFQNFPCFVWIIGCLARGVSIARLEQTMEFLCSANGATFHYVPASFVLFHSVRTQKPPLLQVRLLTSYVQNAPIEVNMHLNFDPYSFKEAAWILGLNTASQPAAWLPWLDLQECSQSVDLQISTRYEYFSKQIGTQES